MYIKVFFCPILIMSGLVCSAQEKSLFQEFAFDSIGIKLYELYTTKEGVTHMTSSVGIWKLKGHEFGGPSVSDGKLYDSEGKPGNNYVKVRSYLAEDSIRSMAQGPDSIFYFVAHDNFFLWRPNGEFGGWGWPPFNFPKTSPILKIWIDDSSDIFAGTRSDNFYIIEAGANKDLSWKGIDFGPDKDSNYIVTKGGKKVTQVIIQPGIGVYSFAQDATDKNIVWIGTNRGLFTYNKQTGKCNPVEAVNKASITITEIYAGEEENIWFSTLEKGMGVYNLTHQVAQFYPYKKKLIDRSTQFPIKTFCYKSPGQFFLAVMDSLPAIFNTESRTYLFFDDSAFYHTPNQTTDIKVDKKGNLILIKGGRFYFSNVSKSELLKTSVVMDSTLLAPFFREVQLENGKALTTLDYNPWLLKRIVLKYDQNSIKVFYDVFDFTDKEDIQFAWKLDGEANGWVEMPKFNSFDGFNVAMIQDLKPGKHLVQLKVKIGKEDWRKQTAEMVIIVEPPFWQTWWFWAAILIVLISIIYLIIRFRIKAVRKQERIKAAHEKELLEMEARALRAQMNPHFIFNCLNSIKALIQEDEKQKATDYLTTFSKLIRTLFQNSDKRQISLFDEVETCRLYTQLEAMRLKGKLNYNFIIDPNVDLKSVMVPALIIQPFIENAIWHGIVPKEEGTINVSITQNEDAIVCEVDDDGIGRELSKLNKPITPVIHESKGVHLSQARIDLEKKLNDTNASIETIDRNDNGRPAGTKVIITFNIQ